jgi:hypothetical protein
MLAKLTPRGNDLYVRFTPESSDSVRLIRKGKPVCLSKNECRFEFPSGWRLSHVHPDLIGLSCLQLVQPYTKRLKLQNGVSSSFAEVVQTQAGVEMTPVDDRLAPRLAPATGRPALAFSGGTDSMAASQLLPSDSLHVFLETAFESNTSIGVSPGAVRACAELERRGKEVIRVRTDMELMRKPRGVSWEWGWAVPAFLLAGDELDSVAFGTIAEAAYAYGSDRFADFTERLIWKRGHALLGAVGMDYNPVTAGITEIGTAKIVHSVGLADFAASCPCGLESGPCGDCIKCFRMGLLTRLVAGEPLEDEWVTNAFLNATVPTLFRVAPLHVESVYAYIAYRYRGAHPLLKAMRGRYGDSELDVAWMEKWYSPSQRAMTEKHRASVTHAILGFLEPMNPYEERTLEGWDSGVFSKDERCMDAHNAFLSVLKALRTRDRSRPWR